MGELLYQLSVKDINILDIRLLSEGALVLYEYRRRLGGNDRWNKAATACPAGDLPTWLRQVIYEVDTVRGLITKG